VCGERPVLILAFRRIKDRMENYIIKTRPAGSLGHRTLAQQPLSSLWTKHPADISTRQVRTMNVETIHRLVRIKIFK